MANERKMTEANKEQEERIRQTKINQRTTTRRTKRKSRRGRRSRRNKSRSRTRKKQKKHCIWRLKFSSSYLLFLHADA